MAEDLLYRDDGDIAVADGDLVIGFSDEQHVQDILVANKGDYKENPVTGVGIINYLDAPFSLKERDNLRRGIMLQLEADGVKEVNINIASTGEINVKGIYKS
jgi:hypothetical protein